MRNEDEPRMESKDLYRDWIEQIWNGPGSAELLREAAARIVTADFVGHWPERDVHGPGELADLVAETKAMFSDLAFEIAVEPLADGDLVAARWVGSGTATDGTVSRFFGNDILRVHEERFSEYWVASAEG